MSKSRHSTPLPLTAAFDRRPAKYFHGRKEILGNFNEIIEKAVQAKSGTAFLIQGAPGAGKTALLDECGKIAGGRDGRLRGLNRRPFGIQTSFSAILGRGDD